MFDKITMKLSPEDETYKREALARLRQRYQGYKDPWGFNIDTIAKALDYIYPIYKNYFKVRIFGTEKEMK